MGIGIVFFVISAFVFLKWRKSDKVWKKMALVVGVMSFLGILVQYQEQQERLLQEDAVIDRNEAGKGDLETDLILNADDLLQNYEYELTVPEEKLGQSEAKEKLDLAEQEVIDTFPGENTSIEHVCEDVIIKNTYQNGLVTAEWSFDNYDYVDVEGHLQQNNIPEEGYLEKAVCELICGDYACTYEFYFAIYPKALSETEKVIKKIGEVLEEQGELESIGELQLPQEIDGHALNWSEKKSQSALKFLALGMILAVGLWMSELEKEKKKEKDRVLLLTLEYPEIVSKLALLLGAGMTLSNAWNQISASYLDERKKNKGKKKPAYEEMLLVCREMESGIGEKNAYEHFGERCGTRRYRKLSSLLIQNVKKGTKGLASLLEEEAEEAFEERKNTARKLGEEAGTKLLLPMMLMLGIVIVLIMIPAVLSFQI